MGRYREAHRKIKIPEKFRRGPDTRTAEERDRHAKGDNPQRAKEKTLCKAELCTRWGRRGWAKGFCKSCASKQGYEDAQRKVSHHKKNVKKTNKCKKSAQQAMKKDEKNQKDEKDEKDEKGGVMPSPRRQVVKACITPITRPSSRRQAPQTSTPKIWPAQVHVVPDRFMYPRRQVVMSRSTPITQRERNKGMQSNVPAIPQSWRSLPNFAL